MKKKKKENDEKSLTIAVVKLVIRQLLLISVLMGEHE
jgi:hypothetical protein